MATRGMSVFTHQGTDYTINDPNIAPEFDATAANNKGDYVNYQGDLYRFDANHDANTAWGNRSKTKVMLGAELVERIAEEATERETDDDILDGKVSDLKSALGELTGNLIVTNRTEPFGSETGITYTPDGKGAFSATGTSISIAALAITDDIILTAGTYRAGYNPSSGGSLYLQVRDFTSGSDEGNLMSETTTSGTFTITETKKVRIRIYQQNNKTVSGYMLYPMLTKEEDWYNGYVPNLTAFDGISRALSSYAYKNGIMLRDNVSEDFNDFMETGFYILGTSTSYAHSPFDSPGPADLFVFNNGGNYIIQVLQSHTNGAMYLRRYAGSPRAWTDWVSIGFSKNIETITDFNDIDTDGWFICAYGTTYAHDPIGSGKDRFVLTFTEQSGSAYRIQIAISESVGIMYGRVKKGNPATWSSWVQISGSSSERTIPFSFTKTAQSSQGQNDGTKLRVMTYNICQFNNDSATYISDEKLLNLKKAFYQANADIIFTQEDREYIDSGDTKSSNSYFYYPVYPVNIGSVGTAIHSKYTLDSSGIVGYTNGRTLRYAVYTTGDIKLLLVSTHPVYNYNSTGGESAESIAARETEYEELFKWVNGDITLNEYGTSTPVTVPEHTHCIIGMDSNSVTEDDKTNILSEATGAGFIAGNGGSIGWFITEMRIGHAIDNVFVSDNIIINNIEAYNDWYQKLYSDHVPVVADLTLL